MQLPSLLMVPAPSIARVTVSDSIVAGSLARSKSKRPPLASFTAPQGDAGWLKKVM